ncbi:MAG TPA: nickel pincer cofactor biosynthesis protein LarC, partial [Vicinamibacterales bacterium]|nr:nickel pincer cofactor biosynthesis protein LarC [Vicinamibacterales bacterium]
MARTLYFDCFSGASGDMVIGALLDLGLPLDGLRAALGSLAIDYGGVSSDRVLRAGVSAAKFRVHTEEALAARSHTHDHHHGDHQHAHSHDHDDAHSHDNDDDHSEHTVHSHHSLAEIAGYVKRSALSREGRDRAMHMFERLAGAEAAIHAMPVEQVHLHEVGAIDSIIDIVGAVHGLEWIGAAQVLSSPLNVGSGTVRCAHGTFPVPAPATARLLTGVPIYSGAVAMELVTPTGALIVTEYASGFQPLPAMRVEAVGYGAGTRDVPGHPNVLRMWLGNAEAGAATDRIVRIECEIDDMNPQLFGPLMDRLAAEGALDVFYAAVQMKKGRPGTLVTVLAPPDRREALAGLLFAETTTIGVRYDEMRRDTLDREIRTVDTPVGPIRIKVAGRAGRVLNAAPEFDDCARIA